MKLIKKKNVYLTLEAEPRKLGLKRQGEGERKMEELQMFLPVER